MPRYERDDDTPRRKGGGLVWTLVPLGGTSIVALVAVVAAAVLVVILAIIGLSGAAKPTSRISPTTARSNPR
jgi:hypothetical protein